METAYMAQKKPDQKAITQADLTWGREMISQLKEMHHYSKNNIELQAEMSLEFDEHASMKEVEDQLNALLNLQNDLHNALDTLIDDWEIVCNRIENEAT